MSWRARVAGYRLLPLPPVALPPHLFGVGGQVTPGPPPLPDLAKSALLLGSAQQLGPSSLKRLGDTCPLGYLGGLGWEKQVAILCSRSLLEPARVVMQMRMHSCCQ